MGAERADVVVALQALLMIGVRSYGDDPAVAPLAQRVLATAAALDYVLALARGATGARIPPTDAERAMREGITRAVDDGLALGAAIGRLDGGRDFARQAARTLRIAIESEQLGDDGRRFALIALVNA